MTNNKINNNEYPYVDLDLPSGTLWATCNVGADKPSDFGLYFQWGDIKGYTKEQVGTGYWEKKFASDENDYRWDPNYEKAGTILRLKDDASYINMGGDWHIPSPDQIQELIDNTTNTWTTLDGIEGMTFTSDNDITKSIFIPATGYAWKGLIRCNGKGGNIWSSALEDKDNKNAQCFNFNVCGTNIDSYYRILGFPVRGVIDKKSYNSKEKKNNMNEKLNLVEILKNVPKGTKLWSPIIGYCEFVEIDEDKAFPIICSHSEINDHWNFKSDGSFTIYDGTECVLFPSKDNRDWTTFKVPKKHKEFMSFQKVLRVDNNHLDSKVWTADFYSHYEESTGKHYLTSGFIMNDNEIIPYDGNEDKAGNAVE